MSIFKAERAVSGNFRSIIASALMATTVLGVGMMTAPVAAQAQARSYDIPAGPLAVALNRFGEAADVELVYESTLTNGISSPGLKGSFSIAETLSRLLTGTGLTFRQNGPRSFTLERAPQSTGNAIQLGPVRVEGADGNASAGYIETTTGPVIGYVARRSQTATKTDTPIIEIPQSVSVIGRDEIEMRGALNMMDIVAQTPGISVNTYGPDNRGWEYINIRGFSANSGNFRDGLS